MNRFLPATIIRRLAPGLLWAAGFTLAVRAQAPETGAEIARRAGASGRATIYSADRRFMVSGMTSAENMVLAGQLAELAGQVEEKTGMPLPLQRDQVLGVMVQSSSSPDAQVLKMQGWDEGRFYQRLVVPGRIRLDGEDLMDGACWLLLNRHAAEYTPASQRAGMGATVPDWISAGLAQNTQAALRSRNRDWISREIAEGRVLSLAQVVKQEVLPPGRWREKAYAAAAVEFLFPDGDLNTWAALFKAVGTRQPIDPAWLRKACPALRDRNPEKAWRGQLEQRARSRTLEAWSDRSLQIEERLLQALNFRPRDLAPGVPDDVPQEAFARDLVDYRGQEWTRSVAAALSLQVQSLKLGAPPPLQDVLASYAAFFDQLTTPPPEKHSWWRRSKKDPAKLRPPDDATWQVALNQLWMRAERAHQDFLENHQTRKRYVDSFDKAAPGAFDDPPPSVSDLPRTRAQTYVDEVEERLGQESF
ncbi:MAG: hypothetical protein EOM72_03570 [Opitutae bacterium]|nr:hypothetical protein [Opitutae bacterium]